MAQDLSPIILKYQAALEQNPRSTVFAPLAEAYRKAGMVDEALHVLKDGIRFNPTYVAGYLTQAACYFDIGQYPLCYATLRPLVENQRDNLKLQLLFARVCVMIEHYEEALDSYKYLLFLNPKDKEIALKVKEIEDRVFAPKKEEPLKKEQVVFHTDNIFTEASGELDDWKQVSFASRKPAVVEESLEIEEEQPPVIEDNIDDWTVQNVGEVEAIQPEEDEEVPETEEIVDEVEEDYEEDEEEDKLELPFVNHTIVDLYCRQGYYEKALEILDKIIELVPNDEFSMKKRAEILKMLSGDENDNQIDGEDALLAALDEQRVTEESEKIQKKVMKLEAFLHRVKAHKQHLENENSDH